MNLEAKYNFIQVKIEVAFCSLKQKSLYIYISCLLLQYISGLFGNDNNSLFSVTCFE